ncbi:hypothetical protein TB1_001559 [Malus domestica]
MGGEERFAGGVHEDDLALVLYEDELNSKNFFHTIRTVTFSSSESELLSLRGSQVGTMLTFAVFRYTFVILDHLPN